MSSFINLIIYESLKKSSFISIIKYNHHDVTSTFVSPMDWLVWMLKGRYIPVSPMDWLVWMLKSRYIPVSPMDWLVWMLKGRYIPVSPMDWLVWMLKDIYLLSQK